jgi:hypothetical protein
VSSLHPQLPVVRSWSEFEMFVLDHVVTFAPGNSATRRLRRR